MSALLNGLLLASSFVLAFVGCVMFALSQTKQWRSVVGRSNPPSYKLTRRWIGSALLLLALPPCILRDGGAFAALLWPLLVSAAALSVALVLAFSPSRLGILAGSVEPSDD